jgi:hypothetical protein
MLRLLPAWILLPLCLSNCSSTKKESVDSPAQATVSRLEGADDSAAILEKFAVSRDVQNYYSKESEVDAKDSKAGRDKRTYFNTTIENARGGRGNKAWESEAWLGKRYLSSTATKSKDSKGWKLFRSAKEQSKLGGQVAKLDRSTAITPGAARETGGIAEEAARKSAFADETWLDRKPSWEANLPDQAKKMNYVGTKAMAESQGPKVVDAVPAAPKGKGWGSLDVRRLLGKRR